MTDDTQAPNPEASAETPAKPSLKDIADKDTVAHAEAKPGGAPARDGGQEEGAKGPDVQAQGGGRGLLWLALVILVAGGGAYAWWAGLGSAPYLQDLRALMGLEPRPTQVRLTEEGTPVIASPAEPAAPEAAAASDAPPPVEAPAPESEPEPEAVSEAAVAAEAPAAAPPEIAEALAPMPATPDSPVPAREVAALMGEIAALKAEVAALGSRLAELESRKRADPTAPAQALVLAATQVRARLAGDGPFAAELAALEKIAVDDAEVAQIATRLRPHAEVGVPSEAALTARFAAVARDVMRARVRPEDAGWMAAVKERLGGLVTVRRTDPATITDEVERAVAVAEAALELGELPDAVEALSALSGAPAEAAAAWLGDAHARVEAEAALEDLHSHALAVLARAGE